MRSFSVTLVFLFLAGTQARHFWQQDAPAPSSLEHFKELLHNYLESAKTSAREVVAQVDTSSFAQHYDLDLSTKVEMVAAVAEQLQEQLTPGYQVMRERLNSEYQGIVEDLAPVKAKLTPLVDGLHANLQGVSQAYYEKLKPLVVEWRQSMRQDMEQLQSRVEPLTAEARDKMRVLVVNFRQEAAPYLDQLQRLVREKVQQVQERAVPRLQEFRTTVQEQIAHLREASAPVVEGLRQRMAPFVKKLEEHLVSLLSTVQRNLEEQSQQQS